MKLKSSNIFKFKDYELECIYTVLHKINSTNKKPGFVKSLQLTLDEIEVCDSFRETLNEYYGMEDKSSVGNGGGVQNSGLLHVAD